MESTRKGVLAFIHSWKNIKFVKCSRLWKFLYSCSKQKVLEYTKITACSTKHVVVVYFNSLFIIQYYISKCLIYGWTVPEMIFNPPATDLQSLYVRILLFWKLLVSQRWNLVQNTRILKLYILRSFIHTFTRASVLPVTYNINRKSSEFSMITCCSYLVSSAFLL